MYSSTIHHWNKYLKYLKCVKIDLGSLLWRPQSMVRSLHPSACGKARYYDVMRASCRGLLISWQVETETAEQDGSRNQIHLSEAHSKWPVFSEFPPLSFLSPPIIQTNCDYVNGSIHSGSQHAHESMTT